MPEAGPTYLLRLDSGPACLLAADGPHSALAAAEVAQIMGLEETDQASPDGALPRAWLTFDGQFAAPPGEEACLLPDLPPDEPAAAFCRLTTASAALARLLLPQGALLLHAALISLPGRPGEEEAGVLLAAAGGTGKSTAAGRVPPPWRALCDDAALVVRDGARWWAHPWPTWSRFLDGPGGRWPVRQGVPLRGVYFLRQAPDEQVEPFGPGQAAMRLVESAGQAAISIFRRRPAAETRALRQISFGLCAELARSLPCAGLRLSLRGPFWQALEAHLAAAPLAGAAAPAPQGTRPLTIQFQTEGET